MFASVISHNLWKEANEKKPVVAKIKILRWCLCKTGKRLDTEIITEMTGVIDPSKKIQEAATIMRSD